MLILRRLIYRLRLINLRKCYLTVIICSVTLCYISFRWSGTERSPPYQGAWQIKALQRSILAQYGQTDARSLPSSHQFQINELNSQLLKTLLQIENQWRETGSNRSKIAKVRGEAEDLKYYEKILRDHGFKIVFQDSAFDKFIFNISSPRFGRKNPLELPKKGKDHPWLLLLCLTSPDGSCLQNDEMVTLKEHQKVNMFPGLKNILSKRSAFCSAMAIAKQIPELRHELVSPLCFVLPKQFSQLVHVTQALGYSVKWTVKEVSSNKSSKAGANNSLPHFLDLFHGRGQEQLHRLANQKVVVQQLHDNPLMIFNQPFSVRVYVLITSIAPLRAYVHSEGLLFLRYGPKKNFKKIPGKMWLLSELWLYLAKFHGGQNSVKNAVSNLSHVLLQMLLILEAAMLSPFTVHDYKICQHCFQLLGVDCVFNSSLHPVVLGVSGQLSPKKGTKSSKINEMMRTLLDDVLGLLFPPFNSVAREVAESLKGIPTDIGLLDWSCALSNDICLSQQDLEYLLKSRRETLAEGGFKQLYPSADASRYQGVAEQLQRQFTNHQTVRLWQNYRRHTTADLHRLLINVERWYEGSAPDEYNIDIDVSSGNSYQWKSLNTSNIFSKEHNQINSSPGFRSKFEEYEQEVSCTNDPATIPYLSSIRTHPAVSLDPAFDPTQTEYSVTVNFEVMLLRVWATVYNCQSEPRLDDRFGTSRPTNTTLGVGENRISFMVVDISLTEPRVINSYTLVIYRLSVTHGEVPFHPQNNHQVCSLKQECDMRLFYNEGCGLQRDVVRTLTWPQYLKENFKKPLCRTGNAEGRWVVPCDSCFNRSTCYWKEGVWHPYHCRYENVNTQELRKCFKNRKLLFIGDSTNRGMMHYLIERLNGTLKEWDKTHDIRLYQNVNNGSTMVSFAYYPQFWLPTNERPLFDKALYQLIQRSRPLENNSNTILVVGGVHWLATQHLYMLLRAVRVERLHGVKLVVKTLGAGFHQPVDSVHSLSMVDQHKLFLHNKGLSEFAHHHNFEVIDTFNITAARYKDFMQGKCACHFHRVVEETNQSVEEEHPFQKRYHVEGPINAIYSEILLSRLCSETMGNS